MRLVIFSDLDGTLLDHETYSYAPAKPALERIARHGLPLVLASSKTAAEVQALHQELGLTAPAIVENGAGLFVPGMPLAESNNYARIREALAELPETLRSGFVGFGDLGTAGIVQATGLPADAAARAADRQFSEPGLWEGSPDDLQAFLAALAERGISARRGGRFLTLSFGKTKADQMQTVMSQLNAERSLALGDAPNDVEMLEAADLGVIVQNARAQSIPPLAGERAGTIIRTEDAGPTGWNWAVLRLLTEAGYT
ncbi:MAG: HAD-IIB family hydrolase [Pseudomonadota bacterium]